MDPESPVMLFLKSFYDKVNARNKANEEQTSQKNNNSVVAEKETPLNSKDVEQQKQSTSDESFAKTKVADKANKHSKDKPTDSVEVETETLTKQSNVNNIKKLSPEVEITKDKNRTKENVNLENKISHSETTSKSISTCNEKQQKIPKYKENITENSDNPTINVKTNTTNESVRIEKNNVEPNPEQSDTIANNSDKEKVIEENITESPLEETDISIDIPETITWDTKLRQLLNSGGNVFSTSKLGATKNKLTIKHDDLKKVLTSKKIHRETSFCNNVQTSIKSYMKPDDKLPNNPVQPDNDVIEIIDSDDETETNVGLCKTGVKRKLKDDPILNNEHQNSDHISTENCLESQITSNEISLNREKEGATTITVTNGLTKNPVNLNEKPVNGLDKNLIESCNNPNKKSNNFTDAYMKYIQDRTVPDGPSVKKRKGNPNVLVNNGNITFNIVHRNRNNPDPIMNKNFVKRTMKLCDCEEKHLCANKLSMNPQSQNGNVSKPMTSQSWSFVQTPQLTFMNAAPITQQTPLTKLQNITNSIHPQSNTYSQPTNVKSSTYIPPTYQRILPNEPQYHLTVPSLVNQQQPIYDQAPIQQSTFNTPSLNHQNSNGLVPINSQGNINLQSYIIAPEQMYYNGGNITSNTANNQTGQMFNSIDPPQLISINSPKYINGETSNIQTSINVPILSKPPMGGSISEQNLLNHQNSFDQQLTYDPNVNTQSSIEQKTMSFVRKLKKITTNNLVTEFPDNQHVNNKQISTNVNQTSNKDGQVQQPPNKSNYPPAIPLNKKSIKEYHNQNKSLTNSNGKRFTIIIPKSSNTVNNEAAMKIDSQSKETIKMIYSKEIGSKSCDICEIQRTGDIEIKILPEILPSICPICNRIYNTRSSLAIHMSSHNGTKPHVCQSCLKIFLEDKGSALPKYVYYQIIECYKCAEEITQPLEGIYSNSAEPYQCGLCRKAFTRLKHLSEHMVDHKKQYKCDKCEFEYKQRKVLRRKYSADLSDSN